MLLCLSHLTRLKKIYAVSQCVKLTQTPRMAHWLAQETIIRYLKDIAEYRIHYQRQGLIDQAMMMGSADLLNG